jgi:hypothetical protein
VGAQVATTTGELASLHCIVGALLQRCGNGKAGGAAGATLAKCCYSLRRRRISWSVTPLEGGDQGAAFLHEGELRREAEGGVRVQTPFSCDNKPRGE